MKKRTHKILIVDDEKEFLDLLKEVLSAEGYEIATAINGQRAVETLEEKGPFSLIITDHKMPVMTGTDFLRAAKELSPNTPRVIVTAYQSAEMMEDSINKAEVFRFLTKPIDVEQLLDIAKAATERYENTLEEEEKNRARDELIQKIIAAIEHNPISNDQVPGIKKEKSLKEKSLAEDGEVTVDMFDMLSALSTALDIINPALNDHHKRTCYIASCLAAELQLSSKEVSTVFMASIMHDIGAIALSDRFKLLDFEETSLHVHAELGALLLSSFPPFATFAPLVRYHHVPWDQGAGEIFNGALVPSLSHLIHLADRIAVLIKHELPIFKQVPAIEEKVFSLSGKKFVPAYVEAFRSISQQEAFWLDLASPALDLVLRKKSQLPDISLGLDGLEQLARFFSTIVDTRSHFTANHSSGVSACAEALASLMNMTKSECKQMRIAGYLHDLGKLAVSEEILEKPGQLSDEEKSIMKSHTYHTYSILKEVDGLGNIVPWASFHHETLTGDGYPFHRNADKLPLGSRVLAVADIFTALTEDRPYRKGMGKEKVEEVFSKMQSDGKIDGSVVFVLKQNFDRINQTRIQAQKIQSEELSAFWSRCKELLQ